jgi:hypothetical protein
VGPPRELTGHREEPRSGDTYVEDGVRWTVQPPAPPRETYREAGVTWHVVTVVIAPGGPRQRKPRPAVSVRRSRERRPAALL